MIFKHAALAVGLLTAGVSAQGVNCALLSTFNNYGPFNDIWGYAAPNGDEYALLCTTTGTVVVDVTNPSNPIERGWFPFGSSSWRDCRTYGTYAYVVTEATSGFQIIDLSNPNNPTAVGTFGTSVTNNAHNVCVDTATGLLYLIGTNVGTPVWDLNTNPANPTYLGLADGSGKSNYYHDLCVENGYFYGSMIYNGDLRISEATTFPPTVISSTQTPGNFTHNAWPNANGTLCVTTDEVNGGVIRIFDITNKANPIGLSSFTPNTNSAPHNAFIVGDKVHVSWYTEGYRCIDISDPSNPVEVASYDTWPGSSGGFNGCWGVYPFLPSGNILVSDRTSGLFVVRPSNAGFSRFGQGCAGSVTSSCPELNPGGGTLEGDTRDNEYCYEAQSSSSINVTSVDFFTQTTGGTVTRPVQIYADSNGGPAATPIASTTITIGPAAQFYTATFATPVSVSGTFYLALDSSSNNVILCSLNNGTSGNGYWRDVPNGTPNWTLSGLIDNPSYRVSCSGGGTLVPSLGNSGLPTLGSTYNVTLSDAAPQSLAVFVTGLSDTVFNGSSLPLALPGAPSCDLLVSADVTSVFSTGGNGAANAAFSVPSSTSNIGLEVFHQWAVLDAVNSLGVVVSDAGRATIDQ